MQIGRAFRIAFWGSLAFATVAEHPAAAQVRLDVDFGFNGRYLPDSFTPLQIRLFNAGPARRVVLEVFQELQTPWRGVVTERLLHAVALGPQTTKTLPLAFYVRGAVYPLVARVHGETTDLLAEQVIELRERASTARLSLALSDESLPATLPTGERVERLPVNRLPRDWAALGGAARIYLGRFDPNTLSHAQRRALEQWLYRGGELVVLGGDNWYAQDSPWLREIIPFEPAEVRELKLTEENAGVDRVVIGRARGQSLWSEKGYALLVRGFYGAGSVYFTAIAPRREPSILWEKLGRPSEVPTPEVEGGLSPELLGLLEIAYPPKLLVGFGIVVYLSIFSLIARAGLQGSRHSVWLAVWVVVVSLGSWLYLHQPQYVRPLRGLEVGLVRGRTIEGLALWQTWYGLFAREETSLRWPTAIDTLRQLLPPERGEHIYDLTTTPTSGGAELQFTLQKLRQRHFYAERIGPLDLAVSASLTAEGTPHLTVENRSPYTLRSAALFWQGKLYPLGTLSAGEAQSATLTAAQTAEQYDRVLKAMPGAQGAIRYRLWQMAGELQTSGATLIAWLDAPDLAALPQEDRVVYRLLIWGL